MHVEPDIASLALARVRALLDSGLSGFGYIRSVFVCLFIPLLVLDSSFVLLAPTRPLLPSDTDPCHSLFDSAPAVAHRDTIHFRISFDHRTSPFAYDAARSVAGSIGLQFFFLLFPHSLLLCVAYTVALRLGLAV